MVFSWIDGFFELFMQILACSEKFASVKLAENVKSSKSLMQISEYEITPYVNAARRNFNMHKK
jgi:hypothetical protein